MLLNNLTGGEEQTKTANQSGKSFEFNKFRYARRNDLPGVIRIFFIRDYGVYKYADLQFD